MERIKTDLCIIGAGAGGLSVAAGAAQMGARVVLIEKAAMGGDCLNTGCIPSKALIAAARTAQTMRMAQDFGITSVEPEVDFAAVQDRITRVIADIAPIDSQQRFEGLGVRVLRHPARFSSPTEVIAGPHAIRARRFVIATGARPRIPPLPGLDKIPYLTTETIFTLRQKPEHLVILGGGPVGLEMAQAHRRLGCRVTVVEAARALNREDPEMSAIVLARLRTEGVEIIEGLPVTSLSGPAGAIRLRLQDGREVTATHLLLATGRQATLEGLDLTAAGVEHTHAGVSVGPGLRSVSNRRVHAIGDAVGGAQFTHLASHHAGVVIRQILLGLPTRARDHAIPRVTYTDPELAQIGLTEAQARQAHGSTAEILRLPLCENDRARTDGHTEGLAKLILVKGRPVGVSITGHQAGELIGLWSLVLTGRIRLSTIMATVLPYPTVTEISKRLAGACLSPRVFDNPWLTRFVGLVQRWLP